jgi:hypothetical protein
VEKQEPNTDSILSSRIMQDSSRHRLDMAAHSNRQAGQRLSSRVEAVLQGRKLLQAVGHYEKAWACCTVQSLWQ